MKHIVVFLIFILFSGFIGGCIGLIWFLMFEEDLLFKHIIFGSIVSILITSLMGVPFFFNNYSTKLNIRLLETKERIRLNNLNYKNQNYKKEGEGYE